MAEKNGAGPMLTSAEAAKRLGITPRWFARLRSKLEGIEGATLVDGAWAFPVASIDKLAERGTSPEDYEQPETIEEGAAALTRAIVQGLKESQEASQKTMRIAINLLEHSFAEGKSKDARLAESQKAHLENLQLLREFMVSTGELEVQRMKAEGDQAVRIERTKVAGKAMHVFMPIMKAGAARMLGNPLIERDAQSETLLELFRKLTPEKQDKLAALLDDKQRAAFDELVLAAAARESTRTNLRTLKEGFLDHPERMAQAQEILDQHEIGAVLSLFESVDDEEKKTP